jgi:hypothetical protein
MWLDHPFLLVSSANKGSCFVWKLVALSGHQLTQTVVLLRSKSNYLLDDLGYATGANSAATFADCETQTFVHSD